MNNDADGRYCGKCNTWKPWDDFHVRRAAATGRQNYCKACMCATIRDRYRADPAPKRAYARACYRADPARHQAANKAWRAANLEQERARGRAAYWANPEPARALARVYYHKHAERARQYAKDRRARIKLDRQAER
jgi:hypothetical protein